MGNQQAGPFAKLQIAKNLPSITEEQRQTLDDFMEQRKAQAETMREEIRTGMQEARQATDRQARQAIMKPLREKMETAQQEVDTLLQSTLTAEQLTEVNTKAADAAKQPGRDRMRGGDDNMTTGAKAGKAGKVGKKGAKGKKAGRDGKRFDRENNPADGTMSEDSDSSTTGTGAANPFATD
jgi:polyhydroxyalkanoate synthesis regulator phasin